MAVAGSIYVKRPCMYIDVYVSVYAAMTQATESRSARLYTVAG